MHILADRLILGVGRATLILRLKTFQDKNVETLGPWFPWPDFLHMEY